MRTINLKIAAGSQEQIGAKGDYVRVKFAPNDVLIENSSAGEIVEGSQGDDFQLSPFKELRITNLGLTDEIFKFTIATGKRGGSSPAKLSGAITLAGQQGLFVQGRASVTNVNQVLIAANVNRRYLLIQNNDAAATLRVNLGGVAATAAQGFRVPAGGVIEIPNFCVSGAINCMMETATAAAGNVEFIQG